MNKLGKQLEQRFFAILQSKVKVMQRQRLCRVQKGNVI